MAKRMKATTIELDARHLSLVSHPRQVSHLIMAASGIACGFFKGSERRINGDESTVSRWRGRRAPECACQPSRAPLLPIARAVAEFQFESVRLSPLS